MLLTICKLQSGNCQRADVSAIPSAARCCCCCCCFCCLGVFSCELDFQSGSYLTDLNSMKLSSDAEIGDIEKVSLSRRVSCSYCRAAAAIWCVASENTGAIFVCVRRYIAAHTFSLASRCPFCLVLMLLSAHFPSLRQRGQPLVPKKWTWVPDETQARLLLKSVTSTNPKHGPGWIAAARVEEFAGKIVQASFVPFFCRARCIVLLFFIQAGPCRAGLHRAVQVFVPYLCRFVPFLGVPSPAMRHVGMAWCGVARRGGSKSSLAREVHPCRTLTSDRSETYQRRKQSAPTPGATSDHPTPLLRLSATLAPQARKTIKAGCEACPDNEDVWLEGARLQTPENAKTVLANAIRNLPTSVKIWLRAAELETSNASKKVGGLGILER